jgi:hypothetical protein
MGGDADGRRTAPRLAIVHPGENVGVQIADQLHAAGIEAELEQAVEMTLRR